VGEIVPWSVFVAAVAPLSLTSLPAWEAAGLSRAILDFSSVWVPLTALDTVSRVLLMRDMCWLKPAVQREAEVFKHSVLVWSPSFCLTWLTLALQGHPLRPQLLVVEERLFQLK